MPRKEWQLLLSDSRMVSASVIGDAAMLSAGTTSCACGSGLSPPQCCALDAGDALPPAVEPSETVLQALYAARRGDIGAAATLCLNLLEQAPTLLPALHLLFLIRRDEGQRKAALALARRIARLAPTDAGMACELTRVLITERRWREADRQARHALRLAPRSADAHELLAMVFQEAKDFVAAVHHVQQALSFAGERRPSLLLQLAQALMQEGALDEARAALGEVLEQLPSNVPALLQMAQVEQYAGNFEQAATLLGRAAAIAPRNIVLCEAQARLAFEQDGPEAALAQLEMDSHGLAAPSINALLLKGRALDRVGRYAAAFEAFEVAQRIDYDEAEARAHLAAIENTAAHAKKFFVGTMIRSLPRATVAEAAKTPIFVAGFARSGTTMIEQSLSMHPDVCAGGEIHALRNVARQAQRILHSPLPYPNALTELWMGDRRHGLDALRDAYLADAGAQHGIAQSAKRFFTDKMIFNEMHLALIGLILPEAPVIHMIRHPLDVVLSVFSHQLSGGMRSRFTLEDIARHYLAVMDLVEHYRREGAVGRYLPVRYEDVVRDQAGQMEKMLAFAGLPFDEACLNFSANPRYARTLSFSQVRRSLNDDGVFRYRHYRRHLSPVYPILAPCIEALGYAIE